MKKLKYIIIFFLALSIVSCGEEKAPVEEDEHHDEEGGAVHISAAQFDALDMTVDTIAFRNMGETVKASGQLEVPPQNEATVTAILGGNISSILVIEGEDVKQGQVLAYLEHPELMSIQGDYLEAYNRLQYLETEFQRQQKLYNEGVASGKIFQQARAEYQASQSTVNGYEQQLRQLGIPAASIRGGNFISRIPVKSPITGSVAKVEVKTGQYVQPERELFHIVNIDHIHADLMVFEKDIYRVREGQQVRFNIETVPGEELYAKIYSVGKQFEQNPKAVHVHAEIEQKTGNLLPGMYINGEIITEVRSVFALPAAAIVREGDSFFAFAAETEVEGDETNWMFTPVEVITGITSNDWVEVKFLQPPPPGQLFAMNNAYYIMAEMKKGEAEHEH